MFKVGLFVSASLRDARRGVSPSPAGAAGWAGNSCALLAVLVRSDSVCAGGAGAAVPPVGETDAFSIDRRLLLTSRAVRIFSVLSHVGVGRLIGSRRFLLTAIGEARRHGGLLGRRALNHGAPDGGAGGAGCGGGFATAVHQGRDRSDQGRLAHVGADRIVVHLRRRYGRCGGGNAHDRYGRCRGEHCSGVTGSCPASSLHHWVPSSSRKLLSPNAQNV